MVNIILFTSAVVAVFATAIMVATLPDLRGRKKTTMKMLKLMALFGIALALMLPATASADDKPVLKQWCIDGSDIGLEVQGTSATVLYRIGDGAQKYVSRGQLWALPEGGGPIVDGGRYYNVPIAVQLRDGLYGEVLGTIETTLIDCSGRIGSGAIIGARSAS